MKHCHINPERHTMTARRSDIEYLIRTTNPKLRGMGYLELRGSQLYSMCSQCNEPIAITDCTFLPESN